MHTPNCEKRLVLFTWNHVQIPPSKAHKKLFEFFFSKFKIWLKSYRLGIGWQNYVSCIVRMLLSGFEDFHENFGIEKSWLMKSFKFHKNLIISEFSYKSPKFTSRSAHKTVHTIKLFFLHNVSKNQVLQKAFQKMNVKFLEYVLKYNFKLVVHVMTICDINNHRLKVF